MNGRISGFLVRALAGWLAAATLPTPALALGPFLQSVSGNRTVVTWLGTEGAAPAVSYWAAPLAPAAAQAGCNDISSHSSVPPGARVATPSVTPLPAAVTRAATPYYLYTATLTGLRPHTAYRYRIASGAAYEFRTAPPPGAPFTFVAFGDSGTGSATQRALARQLLLDHCTGSRFDLLIHTGDLAYPAGRFEEFLRVHFNVYEALLSRVAYYPTPGNHDLATGAGAPYLALHVLPAENVPPPHAERYYSFDWGDAHFVSIDDNYGSPVASDAFQAWLARDLAASERPWNIAYFHVAAISTGQHGPSPLARALIPLLEAGGVDLVLQGHDHIVQRTRPLMGGEHPAAGNEGIVYVVTGAGNAASYRCTDAGWLAFKLCGVTTPAYTRVQVSAAELLVEQVTDAGRVIDAVTLRHPQRMARASD